MSKSLIITEKPSVAGDIAKALGGFKKGKDYYESEKYLISWAVGHLFEESVEGLCVQCRLHQRPHRDADRGLLGKPLENVS